MPRGPLRARVSSRYRKGSQKQGPLIWGLLHVSFWRASVPSRSCRNPPYRSHNLFVGAFMQKCSR